MKKLITTSIVLALIQFAKAQDSTQINSLDDVVVTATKAPKKLSETGKLIEVISKEQIEHSGGKDLSQLLNEQVGITVNGATSNPGKDKSLYLLGATDKYTLILLDGIPLNEPAGVGGSFDLRLLSLDNIERIEILQGSQSTLYGSNAVAGVVNIISKKPVNKHPNLNGLFTYGSYNSFKGNANISQKTKVFDYDLNYTYYKSDGISEAKDTTGKAKFDKDGFTQNALQAIVGINVTDKLKLSPYYRYTKFKGGYDDDAFIDALNHYNASLVNTGLNGHYNYTGGSLYFNYGYDFTKRDYESAYPFESGGKFHNAEAYVHQIINKNVQVIAGLSYQSYKVKDIDTVNNIISPYASFFVHNNGFNLELGGRFNQHNRYGNNFTYSLNPSYLINNTVKVFVNLTSGFRAPSVNELFGLYGANAELKPEKSNTQEAGIQFFLANKKLSATLNGFNRNITNVIVYDYTSNPIKYINLDKQHDYGAELELNYRAKKWRLNVSYAYITGKLTDKSSAKDSSYYNLVRRPKNALKLFTGYNITPALFVSTSFQLTGKRTDNYFNPITFASSQVDLNAYTLWNAYAQYNMAKNKFSLFIDVKNISNKKNYYEVYGYNVEGFNAMGGIRFNF